MTQYAMLSLANPANYNVVNIHLASQQWSNLRNVLVNLGQDVVVIPPSPVLSLFSGQDPGVIYKHMFIPNNNKGYGVDYITKWFEDHQYSIKKSNLYNRFSSADVVFNIERTNLWYGIGGSSYFHKAELDVIFENASVMVRGLELINPKFKSLNQAFCPLDEDTVMWYPAAFSIHSRHTIETWYKNSVRVSEEDAIALGCSAIVNKDKVIIPMGVSYELIERLMDINFTVIPLDISEFVKLKIGLKSLALEVIE